MFDTLRRNTIRYDAMTAPAPTSGMAGYSRTLEPLIRERLELGAALNIEPAHCGGFQRFGGSTVLDLEGVPTRVLYQGYFAGGRALVVGAWRQAE